MDEWLGAELEVTGTVTKLAAETVEVIKAAETLNLWTAGDVPKQNSLDDAQVKEVWTEFGLVDALICPGLLGVALVGGQQ